MNLKAKIEASLSNFLDELAILDDMSEVLIIKAKLECLRISAETLAKVKSGNESTVEYKLPDFDK